MKSHLFWIFAGVAVCVFTYTGVYFFGTARSREIQRGSVPELAWLKSEFDLSEDEYRRISELHVSYLPECERMCGLIAEKNEEIREFMKEGVDKESDRVKAIGEAVQLRAECRQMMLDHFYKVSREMKPGPRERYLEWVMDKTMTPSHKALDETLHRHP